MKYLIELSDSRNRNLKKLLEERGEEIEEFIFGCEVKERDYEGCIFSPARKFTEEEVRELPNNIKLFAGNVNKNYLSILEEKSITHFNYLDDDVFAYKNAVLTGEGVLALLIENTDKSIYENRIIILGYGRVGKTLGMLLDRLKINFDVVSRNPKDIAYASINARKIYHINEFKKHMKDYDVVLNTIPYKLFEDEELDIIADDTLVMEIASVNCLNSDKAERFKFIIAPGLPQKYSSLSAARVMLKNILGEESHD